MTGRLPRATTRREFARTLAVAAAAAPLAGACAGIPAEPAAPPEPRPPETPPPDPAPAPAAGQDEPVEAEMLFQLVRARHGQHLTEAQLQAVRRDIVGGLRSAHRLREVPLDNAAAPACGLGPFGLRS